MFKGVFTALITPFKDNKLDLSALAGLLERQIDADVDGIVVGGSTGEGSSLSEAEYYELIKEAVKYGNRRVAIIAGLTAVSTFDATQKVAQLCTLGVDGLMCTTPHYIKPEQEGIFLHYKAINDVSSLPVMIYIHPVRTSCDLSDEVLLKIANLENMVAVKDASSDLEKPLRILPQLGSNFYMLTGNDSSVLAYNANGGAGCVSVIANIFPKLCKKLDRLWHNGRITEALELQQKLIPLFSAIFAESNPIGIKYAAAKMNLCNVEMRLPLTLARKGTAQKINQALPELITMEENV